MAKEIGKWFKASASGSVGNCVEACRREDGGIDVRDSKANGTGPVLSFTGPEWEAFLDGARKGEFDLA